jgi:predicted dehydrogenase
LARDDAEQHRFFARAFLRAGLPVYVDKPPALSVKDLDALFDLAQRPEQIFSCSALRYAEELMLSSQEALQVGAVQHVSGVTPRTWERYAAHVIDPALSFLRPGKVEKAVAQREGTRRVLHVEWETGCTGTFEATGLYEGDISLTYTGKNSSVTKVFRDSFSAFKSALNAFVIGVRSRRSASPYEHLRSVVELIEAGTDARSGRRP